MENYEKLIAEIDEIVKRIKGLYDLAYTQYSHAVDEVISGLLTDEKQIEHTGRWSSRASSSFSLC